jgi:hypothetical protein
MSLTKAQIRHAMRWFKAKAKDCKCPVCGEDSWGVETSGALPETYGRQGWTLKGMIEVVVITCLNCKHFLLFSGGILDVPIPEDKS